MNSNTSHLSDKPLILIDLGSGSYVQTKVGHEYYNLLECPFDGRYYGYCPPSGNIDIKRLGAASSEDTIENVIVVYTKKYQGSNDRIVIAFTDCATIHKKKRTDKKLKRIIKQNGKTVHCSYSIESDYMYNLDSYPNKLIIDISKYNPYMFRKQRCFKGTYKDLDMIILKYLGNYLGNKEYIEDELYQNELQIAEFTPKDAIKNSSDKEPQYAESSGSLAVKKNIAYAKQALYEAKYLCAADSSHKTFFTKKGVQYMEGHHLIPCTANNAKKYWDRFGKSIDCVENIVCLCPTCHRRIHFGSKDEKTSIIKLLFSKHNLKLKQAGLVITEKELFELYLK